MSMHKSNVPFTLLIFVLDNEAVDILHRRLDGRSDVGKYYIVPYEVTQSIIPALETHVDFAQWGESAYKVLTFYKIDIMRYMSSRSLPSTTKATAFIDTDMYLFKDPTEIFLKNLDLHQSTQVFTQCDEDITGECVGQQPGQACRNPCSGIVVMRRDFVLMVDYTTEHVTHMAGDQQLLNIYWRQAGISRRSVSRLIVKNGRLRPRWLFRAWYCCISTT